MARTMPPMKQVLRDIGGVEIPDSLVKFAQNEPVTTAAAGNGAAGHACAAADSAGKAAVS